MNKVIKIQNNIGKSISYNAHNIETILSGGMEQQINYQVLDEYNLPIGTYVTLRNYDDILFDEATKQRGDAVYTILQSNEVPDCETMSEMYNTYVNTSPSADEQKVDGVVVISTSEEIYNEIVVETKLVDPDKESSRRITNIYLNGEFSTLTEAIQYFQAENPVVIEFDDIFTKCAKYWKTNTINDVEVKTSAFDDEQDNKLVSLPMFTEGDGDYICDSASGCCNREYWNKFQQTVSDAAYPGGSYYLADLSGTQPVVEKQTLDYNCNIFDVLYRQVYDYLCRTVEESSQGSENGEGTVSTQTVVSDPSVYTFLLKSYKMYVKSANTIIPVSGLTSLDSSMLNGGSVDGLDINTIKSYSAKVLTVDEIQQLSADEAQEYFDNTIVFSNETHIDKLILSESEAKEVLVSKGVNSCGQYFLISSKIGIQVPSSQQYEYFDLGNFELSRETTNIFTNKKFKTTYKYNTNGQIVRVRRIYDAEANETYNITKNNSGEFVEGYTVSKNGVVVRGVSGKEDRFYFDNTDEGLEAAEQLREDIEYAMEDGPSIVVSELLLDIE